MSHARGLQKIRVWDLPTRLFHWLLAISIVAAFISVKIGGNAMVWHGRFGDAALALILFRLAWGVVGPHYARFAQFVKGPSAILQELRGDAPRSPGHNPLGALSVLAMLLLIGLQAGLGLFSSDDIAFDGPLAKHVSSATVEFATRWHHRFEWLLIGLIILHIAAVIWHQRVKGHDLVRPMITGDQWAAFSASLQAARDDAFMRARAIVLITLAALLVAYLSR
ncbi:MAG: cytochrome b [Burkholderiaceae bacterium]|nr:cytochrome b [Burkholderiaceae bacterium]